ncbi:MAG: rRNA maturation RNase YbeY [Tatlockia sp.]|nr:rRNA maturation RNase YbeY [Tatlockia sp.]
MSFVIDIQHACDNPVPVRDDLLIKWAESALSEHQESAELTLRIVNIDEIQQLNNDYRHQNKATNVLAFPSVIPDGIELEYPLLGDVIICPEVLEKESLELKKPLEEHWAHIVIHGVLHLLGYDHIKDDDAFLMQVEEIKLLLELGFTNPYPIEEEEVE